MKIKKLEYMADENIRCEINGLQSIIPVDSNKYNVCKKALDAGKTEAKYKGQVTP